MRYKHFSKSFNILFLSIFFLKMVCSVAPLIVEHFDPKAANSIIMQLEIENSENETNSSKKDLSSKDFYSFISNSYKFFNIYKDVDAISIAFMEDRHIQHFFPPVPTPPPNT